MNNVSKKIEAIRKEKGVKQSDLAKEIGISLATYHNLLNSGDFRLSHIYKICDLLDTKIDYLFGYNSFNDNTEVDFLKIDLHNLINYVDALINEITIFCTKNNVDIKSFLSLNKTFRFMNDYFITKRIALSKDYKTLKEKYEDMGSVSGS